VRPILRRGRAVFASAGVSDNRGQRRAQVMCHRSHGLKTGRRDAEHETGRDGPQVVDVERQSLSAATAAATWPDTSMLFDGCAIVFVVTTRLAPARRSAE